MHPDDKGGLRMYPMSLYLDDDADLDAVASYVAGLPAAPPAATLQGGDPAKGKILYTPCIACHGAQAEGKKELGGPNLRVSADWYMRCMYRISASAPCASTSCRGLLIGLLS